MGLAIFLLGIMGIVVLIVVIVGYLCLKREASAKASAVLIRFLSIRSKEMCL